jgi:hypothetical protein
MAIGNYGRALGQMIRESAGQTVKGFGLGLKASAMREMPGLTAIYGISRDISSRANKNNPSAEVVKEQKVNNVIIYIQFLSSEIEKAKVSISFWLVVCIAFDSINSLPL